MGFLFGKKTTQAAQLPVMTGIPIQTSVQGRAIPIIYGTGRVAPNLIWYGAFTAKVAPSSGGGGGGGKGGVVGGGTGKGGSASGNYTYTASLQMALCEGPILNIGNVYIGSNISTPSAQGFTIFDGSYSQSPWPYLSSSFPAQALNYHGLAYACAANYSLGNSASLPNHNFEVFGFFSNTSGNGYDADPSLVLNDLLTNQNYGIGFPSARVGDLKNYQNYCFATGLFISTVYDTQQQSSSMLDDLTKNTNSAIVWSSGLLNVIPYGDVTITGNGKTYTAPAAPLYDLTDDDFMVQTAADISDPVMLSRSRKSDSINNLKMEFQDRTQDYNTGSVEVSDLSSIEQYGLRQDASNNAHLFTSSAIAQVSAQLQLYRQQLRNIYTFTLDQRYILLDPMDIVTLTDTKLGLNKQWVRILTITEQEDYSLVFTAEEYLQGTGSPALYNFQENNGSVPNYNSDPGDANTPVVFEPPVQIATNTGLETWIATSGGPLWGGCNVYISHDNVTYDFAGKMQGPSRQGLLTTILPSGSDPDTMDTLTVDLTESGGSLLSGSQSDADLGHTLCYVDGELIAYQTATLTAANKYSLTYLRRGMYGTKNSAHNTGTQFARLDNQILVYPYDPSQIGSTVYIKICGFNLWGGGQQSLADVSPYTHVIQGPPPPPDVTGFTAKQVGDTVAFTWDPIVLPNGNADIALKGFVIAYAPSGSTDWNQFATLTDTTAGTEMTNASVPFGIWTFGIRAIDIAGQLSTDITTTNLTVVNNGNKVALQDSAPDWELGSMAGLVKHWTGILIPQNQYTPSHYSSYQDFNTFVADPVSSASYTASIIDIGYTDNCRVLQTITQADGPSMTGAPATQTLLNSWATGASNPNVFTAWSGGFTLAEFYQSKFTITGITSTNANFYQQFETEIDHANNTTQSGSIAVPSSGVQLTYPVPFHSAPFVTGTAVSSSPLTVSAAGVTATTANLYVWTSSGAASSGTVAWSATGE